MKEKPLFVLRKHHEEIREADVRTAFQQLKSGEKQQFLYLRDNASKPFSSMNQACGENSFAISDDPPIHGLFLLHSRFNHSCLPNSKVPSSLNGKEIISSFATRDIMAGEEITFCYETDFECRMRSDRHRELRFTCDCKACLPGTQFQQLSDLRRTFIRALQYLTVGSDLRGQRQGSDSPFIIISSQLKKAAEDFSIPLSARLIYILLTMVLIEEEGLMDDFMVDRFHPGILAIANSFKTGSNSRIAGAAMAQKTWMGKFCMALKFWGRRDVADDTIALQLRLLHGLGLQDRF